MTLLDWPANERPREKLLLHGEKNLSTAELLAILIHSGIQNKNSVELSREILNQFGNLKNLFNCTLSELRQIKGIGLVTFTRLKAALELTKRCALEKIISDDELKNSIAVKAFLSIKLKDYSQEVFACLFLNNQFKLLAFEELFRGTIAESVVYPREVLKRALANNAGKIILAHNHPSGLVKPSQADLEITKILKHLLSQIDVQLVDHIIVGQHDTFSFAENSLLS